MPPTDSPAYLTPHFSLAELTFSQEAQRSGLTNEPDDAARRNLVLTANLLEDIRTLLGGVPMLVSSGYRSRVVNGLVRGARNSAHVVGLACDFIAPRFGNPLAICRRIDSSPLMYRIDQLIYEGTWVHVGLAAAGTKPLMQVLTAKFTTGAPTTYSIGLPK